MLHPIDTTGYSKGTKWCGPGALATLTGIPLVKATEMLTRIHGGAYEDLEGTWEEDVILALHELGYRATPVDIIGRYPDLTHGPTLDRFISERKVDECVTPLLIMISGHFVTSHFGFMNDNWTLRPVRVADFPKMKRLVKAVWKIEHAIN